MLSNHLLSSCIWYEEVIISFWWVLGWFMHFSIMTSSWRHISKCWPLIKMARGLKCSGGSIVPINAKTWNCTWNFPVRPTSYRLLLILPFFALKMWISKNRSIFLFPHLPTTHKQKIVMIHQEMRPVVRKHRFC